MDNKAALVSPSCACQLCATLLFHKWQQNLKKPSDSVSAVEVLLNWTAGCTCTDVLMLLVVWSKYICDSLMLSCVLTNHWAWEFKISDHMEFSPPFFLLYDQSRHGIWHNLSPYEQLGSSVFKCANFFQQDPLRSGCNGDCKNSGTVGLWVAW